MTPALEKDRRYYFNLASGAVHDLFLEDWEVDTYGHPIVLHLRGPEKKGGNYFQIFIPWAAIAYIRHHPDDDED